MVQKIILIGLAGAAGTLTRYGLSNLVQRFNSTSFPWGTVVVNVCGCFLAGFLWASFENRISMAHDLRLLVFIGFMGAFTTFSTFILETSHFMRASEWMSVFTNLTVQTGVGFAALFLGMSLSKIF